MHLVDSFNLSRRMAWVRGNQSSFPLIDLTGSAPTPSTPTIDQWMQELAVLPVGESVTQAPWRWTRVPDCDGWCSEPGIWVAIVAGAPCKVSITNPPGGTYRVKKIGATGHLQQQDHPTLKLIARRSDIET